MSAASAASAAVCDLLFLAPAGGPAAVALAAGVILLAVAQIFGAAVRSRTLMRLDQARPKSWASGRKILASIKRRL